MRRKGCGMWRGTLRRPVASSGFWLANGSDAPATESCCCAGSPSSRSQRLNPIATHWPPLLGGLVQAAWRLVRRAAVRGASHGPACGPCALTISAHRHAAARCHSWPRSHSPPAPVAGADLHGARTLWRRRRRQAALCLPGPIPQCPRHRRCPDLDIASDATVGGAAGGERREGPSAMQRDSHALAGLLRKCDAFPKQVGGGTLRRPWGC